MSYAEKLKISDEVSLTLIPSAKQDILIGKIQDWQSHLKNKLY